MLQAFFTAMFPGSFTDLSLVEAAHCYAKLFSNALLHTFSDEKKEEVYENFLTTFFKHRNIASTDMKEIDPIFRVIFSKIIPNDEEWTQERNKKKNAQFFINVKKEWHIYISPKPDK